jgi:hypothetical protein
MCRHKKRKHILCPIFGRSTFFEVIKQLHFYSAISFHVIENGASKVFRQGATAEQTRQNCRPNW